MDRSSLSPIALLACLTACSSFVPDDPAPSPDTPARGQEAAPPARERASTSDLDERVAVFVAAHGSDAADGSRARPLRSIGAAIAMAKASGRHVYACAGTYPESFTLASGVSVIGNLDCRDGAWHFDDRSLVTVVSPASPAVSAFDVTEPTTLRAVHVLAPEGREPGASSVALRAVRAPLLTLERVRLEARRAASGATGTPAPVLLPSPSAAGEPGVAAHLCVATVPSVSCAQPSTSSAGGDGRCSGPAGHDAGDGGRGGRGGTYFGEDGQLLPWTYPRVEDGGTRVEADVQTIGESAPQGGAAGAIGVAASAGAPGKDGKDGASGAAGTLGSDGAFLAGDGVAGGDGTPGRGGGGGRGFSPALVGGRLPLTRGNGGGGGGAGGCPGLAGGAGGGGGASIALVAVGGALVVIDSVLVADEGGAGGRAALPSAASPGGAPGPGAVGGAGAPGGRGGRGGLSGHGSGGPSLAIAWSGAEPRTTRVTMVHRAGGQGVPATQVGERTMAASPDGAAAPALEVPLR